MDGNFALNISKMRFNSTTTETITYGNTSVLQPSDDEILGPAVVLTFIILRAVQGILSIVGNLVTIIAVFTFEMLRENPACRMVASLALADFFWGMASFCGNPARQLSSSVSFLNSLCYVRVFFNLLSGHGNVYFTLLCTLDRYVFITRPLRYQSIVTLARASRAILIVWMVLVLQTALILSLASTADAEKQCSYEAVINRVALRGIIAQFVLITFCVIVPLYGVIGYISWKANKTEPHISNYPPEAQSAQKEKLQGRKWAKTIGLVLGSYIICYTPFLVGDLVVVFSFSKPYPFEILLVRRMLTTLYNMQAILNPFIYAWKNVHFRQAYNKLLSRRRQVASIQQ